MDGTSLELVPAWGQKDRRIPGVRSFALQFWPTRILRGNACRVLAGSSAIADAGCEISGKRDAANRACHRSIGLLR
jgi:hypothetical protein